MESFDTVTFCASFFSILYILFLLYASKQENIFEPNSPLPASVKNLFGSSLKEESLEFVNPLAPWTTAEGLKVIRQQIKCKRPLCSGKNGYTNQLPVLEDPENLNGQWSSYANAWNLTSTEHFLTLNPSTYPLATVLIVPETTPSSVQFLIDSDIVPAFNGLLNVTGPFAQAFVICNNSNHTMYYTRSIEASNSENTYWSLVAQSKTLVWPAETYTVDQKFWLASTLALNELEGAYACETLMFNRF